MCNCVLPSQAFWVGNRSKMCFINRYIHCACFQLSRLWGQWFSTHFTTSKPSRAPHNTSLFFWVFTEITLWFFWWNPTSFATHHPSPPTIPPNKNAQRKIRCFHQNCWRHLFGLGPVHVGYIAVKRGDGAGFLLPLKFLTVLTGWRAVEMRYIRCWGTWFLLENLQGLKRCANDGKFVFSDSDEALGECFKKSPGQFVQIFSKSWFIEVDFKKHTLSTKKHPKKA